MLAVSMNCISGSDWDTHDPSKMKTAIDCLRSKKASDIATVEASLPNHLLKWCIVQVEILFSNSS